MIRLLWTIFFCAALVTCATAQVTPKPTAPVPAQMSTPRAGDAAANGAAMRNPIAALTDPGKNVLSLTATFGADSGPVRNGIEWRVFDASSAPDGSHPLVARSQDANPFIALADGNYIVHAAYGLAGATKWIVMNGRPASERVVLNAGALRITSMLGDVKIPAARLLISIYVAEPGNSEAKLVVPSAKPGDLIGLPEGTYHIVSVYLDAGAPAAVGPSGTPANATNSVIDADIRVQAGKLTDTTLHHHAATITLKLVNTAGGEALANTTFTVLTPGGDVIREMIGAFPSMILAEGEYVAIARHDGKTYQSTFTVQSALDRDVEVIAQ
jgi:hypothetical protein